MNQLELSPADFRRLAERISTIAEQWLAGLDARAIAPSTTGTATEALFAEGLPEEGLKDAALDALAPVMAGTRAGNAGGWCNKACAHCASAAASPCATAPEGCNCASNSPTPPWFHPSTGRPTHKASSTVRPKASGL